MERIHYRISDAFLVVSNEEFTMLAKTYHYRQERLTVGLRYQIQLQEH